MATRISCAHWIRHSLTAERLLVREGTLLVRFARPPGTDDKLGLIFTALRNHYRLVHLYIEKLRFVGVTDLTIDFQPEKGIPGEIASSLDRWQELPDFQTESAMIFHLLGSFMPMALLDERRLSPPDIELLKGVGLQSIDLTDYYRYRGIIHPKLLVEQSFAALSGAN